MSSEASYRIVDIRGRRFRSLQLSSISACNCARLRSENGALPLEKFLTAVEYLKQVHDLRTLRLAGGKLSISPLFDRLEVALGSLDFEGVSLTNNDQLLSRKVGMLRDAAIKRINVSLETLNPRDFRRIARGGDLSEVLSGIEKALGAGLQLKINIVPMRGHNYEQILLDFCLALGAGLRFIELIRMGHLASDCESFSQQFIGMQKILALVSQRHFFAPLAGTTVATTQRSEIPGRGCFGIIANESAPFCVSCTCLRLTSTGWLYRCLSFSRSRYFCSLLDLPKNEALTAIRESSKRALADKQRQELTGDILLMKLIGG